MALEQFSGKNRHDVVPISGIGTSSGRNSASRCSNKPIGHLQNYKNHHLLPFQDPGYATFDVTADVSSLET